MLPRVPSRACARALALSITAALSLPATAWAQDAASAPAVAAAAPPALGEADLDVEQAARLKGLRKVALAGMALYVMTEDSGGATAGAALRGGMAYVNSAMKVTGLEPARLQALADQALAQTRAALQARGIEVVPAEQLAALPEFAALRAVADTAPLDIDTPGGKGTVYSGGGLPLIHLDEGAWLHRTVGGLFGAKVADPYVALGDKMSVGFRKVKLDPALDALAQAAGAPLVMGRVVLAAAQVKAQGGAFALMSKTEVRNSLMMPAWTTRLLVRSAGGDVGRVSLKQGLVSDDSPGELVDVTSTGAKVADVLTTALTAAAAFYGKGRAVGQSSQALELRTSPDRFDAVALPQMRAALGALSQGLTP